VSASGSGGGFHGGETAEVRHTTYRWLQPLMQPLISVVAACGCSLWHVWWQRVLEVRHATRFSWCVASTAARPVPATGRRL
jgi:hypothetical protein